MANVLHNTEAFEAAYWTPFDVTVTTNTDAAPAFAGASATLADTITDASTTSGGQVLGTYETIPNDGSDWTISLYVKKDGVTARCPALGVQFAGGTGIFAGIALNTATGATATASGFTAPAASAGISIDPLWWRIWMRVPNNNTGNTVVRVFFYPAFSATVTGGSDTVLTGSIIAWGINLTKTSTVMAYEPDPTYVIAAPIVPIVTMKRAHFPKWFLQRR